MGPSRSPGIALDPGVPERVNPDEWRAGLTIAQARAALLSADVRGGEGYERHNDDADGDDEDAEEARRRRYGPRRLHPPCRFPRPEHRPHAYARAIATTAAILTVWADTERVS